MGKTDDVRSKFGKHLRELRNEKGWTQEELADRANLHSTYVGQIERGIRNPSLINLRKIADALGVDSGKLMKF